MNITDQIQKLFLLHILGELSPEQERELWAWRRLSAENESLFHEAADWDGIRRGIRRMMDSKTIIFKKIQQEYPIYKQVPSQGNRFTKINWKIAAVLGLAIVLIAVLFLIWNNEVQIHPGRQQAYFVDAKGTIHNTDNLSSGILSPYQEVELKESPNGEMVLVARNHFLASDSATQKLITPRGGQFAIELPGIMNAWLNAESQLEFPANFNQKSMTIHPSGEIYISMDEQTSHPLIFSIGKERIQAERASFNLHSYPGEAIRLTLFSGVMELLVDTIAAVRKEYEIKPGQQVIWSENSWQLANADRSETIAWKNGRTYFKDADIKTIMRALSRWYDFNYQVEGNLSDKKFSLDFPRNATVSTLFESLRSQGIHCIVDGRKVTLMP